MGAVILPQTYRAEARHPDRSRWVRASCADVGCPEYLHGWRTVLDEATPDGARMAAAVRGLRDRHFTESREGALTVFTFPHGQACFRALEHYVAPPRYIWGVEGQRPAEIGGAEWVGRFQEHSDRVSTTMTERYGNDG